MSVERAPSADAVPVHRRTIGYDVFDAGDELLVVGRLSDTRPWAGEAPVAGAGRPPPVTVVHDMELQVTVRVADLTITGAAARMHTFPHAECPAIVDAFAGLAGLCVTRGYTREVQRRFGGPAGCTHLDQLARSLGPVVVQAVTSRRAAAVSRGELDDLITGTTGSPWARDSCHVWAEGGIADQKLAAGWRPGTGPYPSLPLAAIRRRGPEPSPSGGGGT